MTKDTPEPPTEPVELGPLRRNLPFLSRALRAYIRAENASFYDDAGAEQGEIVVLSVLANNPGISQNALAETLVFKKSAVTKLIKGLEDRGLIHREKAENDKRFNALHLTAAGAEKFRRIDAHMAAQHAALLEPFSRDECDQLFALLNRLHTHLALRHAARSGTGSHVAEQPGD
ncbi:MarR family winged helix-turn-helix transcriptional regulator [Plastorhodobacter daqingensis]|uniref:MarR family winged helix-turn-helix transcriptional regulator n=1 Tax=Plastorhodobacter daqingensis TaxID=1387281 RepID=A0ABW2UJM7_9RHOB